MKTVVLMLAVVLCTLSLHSQSRIPMLGEPAPSFHANSTNSTFEFPKDFGNSWKILLSHPKDFTPVSTSEILQLAQMQNEIKSINFYPINIGRNMEEIKRIIVAFQTSERDQVLIPANWKEG